MRMALQRPTLGSTQKKVPSKASTVRYTLQLYVSLSMSKHHFPGANLEIDKDADGEQEL